MNSNKIILKHKLDGVAGPFTNIYDAPRTKTIYKGIDPSDLLARPSVAIVGSRR